MFIRKHWAILALLLLATGATVISSYATGGPGRPQEEGVESLTLELKADRDAYLPGEVVALKIRATNKTAGPVLLHAGADVWSGRVKVLVSHAGGNYLEYFGPGWGLRETLARRTNTLQPGQFAESEATVLYNNTVETSHLSEEHARRIAGNRIRSGYAFPTPGVYSIKAVMFDAGYDKSIESAPLQIVIQAPVGADAEVWDRIRNDAGLGYFIQSGSSLYGIDDHRTAAMLTTLEGLAARHPESGHAKLIGDRVSQFRSKAEKIRASKRKNH